MLIPGSPRQGCCGGPRVCRVGLGFNKPSFALRAGLADTTVLHPFRLLRFHTKLLSPLGFPIRLGGVLKVLFSTFPASSRDLTNAETAHTAPLQTGRATFISIRLSSEVQFPGSGSLARQPSLFPAPHLFPFPM